MTESTLESAVGRKTSATLRDLLAPLFRRKRAFVLSFFGAMLGTAMVAFVLGTTHKASMEILVDRERADPTVTAQSTQGQPSAPAVSDYDIGSEVELLKSPDLLEAVVRENHLQEREKRSFTAHFHPGADDNWFIARATQHLESKLTITAVPKSNLIGVDYKAMDPHLAYGVLQSLGKMYLAKHLAVHRPQGAYSFFATETQKYQQALADSEGRLAAFSKTMGTASPDVQRSDLAQQVVSAVGALESARQAIAADKRRIEDEAGRLKAMPERSLAQQSTDSAQLLMQQLQGNLLSSQLKKTQLLMKYDPSYPLVQEADQEINETQAAIAAAEKQQYVNQTTDRDPTFEVMKEDIAKTQADLAFHQASAKALRNSIGNLQSQIVDLDQKALKQSDLIREAKADEANYLLYLSKREQERTSDALDEKRISNVTIAVPPVLPILPWVGPVLVFACGIVASVFIATGAIFLAEYFDPSLRTPSEVIDVLRIPVLASVPRQSA